MKNALLILKKIREKTNYLFPLACFFIIVLASIKFSPIPNAIHISDKANHTIAFFVLSFIAQISYPKLSILKKFLLLLSFGIFIELIQALLPWRSCELLDIVADLKGIVLFFLLYKIVLYKRHSS